VKNKKRQSLLLGRGLSASKRYTVLQQIVRQTQTSVLTPKEVVLSRLMTYAPQFILVVSQVTFKEYPGMGHSACDEELAHVGAFLNKVLH
jgi:hypothetical protein